MIRTTVIVAICAWIYLFVKDRNVCVQKIWISKGMGRHAKDHKLYLTTVSVFLEPLIFVSFKLMTPFSFQILFIAFVNPIFSYSCCISIIKVYFYAYVFLWYNYLPAVIPENLCKAASADKLLFRGRKLSYKLPCFVVCVRKEIGFNPSLLIWHRLFCIGLAFAQTQNSTYSARWKPSYLPNISSNDER